MSDYPLYVGCNFYKADPEIAARYKCDGIKSGAYGIKYIQNQIYKDYNWNNKHAVYFRKDINDSNLECSDFAKTTDSYKLSNICQYVRVPPIDLEDYKLMANFGETKPFPDPTKVYEVIAWEPPNKDTIIYSTMAGLDPLTCDQSTYPLYKGKDLKCFYKDTQKKLDLNEKLPPVVTNNENLTPKPQITRIQIIGLSIGSSVGLLVLIILAILLYKKYKS